MSQALKELLEQIQKELRDHNIDQKKLREVAHPHVKQFLQQDSVKEALVMFRQYGPAT